MEQLGEAIGKARARGDKALAVLDTLPPGLVGRDEDPEARAKRLAEEKAAGLMARAAYFGALHDGRTPPPEAYGGRPMQVKDGLPACRSCKGARLVRRDVPVGHEDFGKLVPCPACLARPDVAPKLISRNAVAAGLMDEQAGLTFASFKPDDFSREAYLAAKEWALVQRGWLIIHGEPGCGKTHLACACVHDLLGRGKRVRFWYAPDLARAAKRAIGQGDGAEDFLLRELMDEPSLVLDDLGAARPTDYVLSEVLEPLFDYRYRRKLPTLVTMISSPEVNKSEISESICRRMQDPRLARVVENTAPQWRG